MHPNMMHSLCQDCQRVVGLDRAKSCARARLTNKFFWRAAQGHLCVD
jgi:hypothetical protein